MGEFSRSSKQRSYLFLRNRLSHNQGERNQRWKGICERRECQRRAQEAVNILLGVKQRFTSNNGRWGTEAVWGGPWMLVWRVCANSWLPPMLPLQKITQSSISSEPGKPCRWTQFWVWHHHLAIRMDTVFGASKLKVCSRASQSYWLALSFVPRVSWAGHTLAASVWETSPRSHSAG